MYAPKSINSIIDLDLKKLLWDIFLWEGRNDSNGGHVYNKNVSGLGLYHYHHGFPAHLHTNGTCNYEPLPSFQVTYITGTTITLDLKNMIGKFLIVRELEFMVANAISSGAREMTAEDGNLIFMSFTFYWNSNYIIRNLKPVTKKLSSININ